jgi:hypothetical protein
MSAMGACCGCGKTGPAERIAADHISDCVKYAERYHADMHDDYLDPAREWERRQREQDDGDAEAGQAEPEAAEPVSRAPARRAEAIPDARAVVLDKRGEAQRESDEIKAGFNVYRRIGVFIRKEKSCIASRCCRGVMKTGSRAPSGTQFSCQRYRDIGYDSPLAWWEGENICEYSQMAEADRKDLVLALTGAGLSVRATGAMLAISRAQVQRDKTGRSDHKATTREGRKATSLPEQSEVSRHTSETAGQAANGGGTPGTVAVAVDEDPFFLDDEPDEDVSAGSTPNGSTGAEDHECVCPACGNPHRRKEEN